MRIRFLGSEARGGSLLSLGQVLCVPPVISDVKIRLLLLFFEGRMFS